MINTDMDRSWQAEFSDLKVAFQHKSDQDLKLSQFIFTAMSYPAWVWVLSKLAIVALQLHLPVKWILKKTVFKQFCAGETLEQCKKVVDTLSASGISVSLDYSVESKNREAEFDQAKNEILKTIRYAANSPDIKSVSVKPTGLVSAEILELASSKEKRSMQTDKKYHNALQRFDETCDLASALDLQILIDAEESTTQNAIDDISINMMRKYNADKICVFITLQMYRWDRLQFLKDLIEKAEAAKFKLGIKLVRGAYWQKEIDRAAKLGAKPVVFLLKEETDEAFDSAVSFCLENVNRVSLCLATHNEESSAHLVKKMREHNLVNDHPAIQFSQLYGMSDHISFNLAKHGYNVSKYLPYGPVESVIPYLIRRAEENASLKGQLNRELRLLKAEKERREKIIA